MSEDFNRRFLDAWTHEFERRSRQKPIWFNPAAASLPAARTEVCRELTEAGWFVLWATARPDGSVTLALEAL